ncbi:MAG: FliI/YscN family ATPase [Deltaproteobacteria bacterium]|nr:FliI/YscN family ATPase [Deltaproteobacteria bacterium]
MKAGRVIGGDEHDARTQADKILDDARTEAERLKRDAADLAEQLVRDARVAAERQEARSTAADLEATAGVPAVAGSVDEVVGLVIRATVPGVSLGEVVKIDRKAWRARPRSDAEGGAEVDRRDRAPLSAEVVGFRGEQAVLLPLGELAGIAPACSVWRTGGALSITCGDGLLGRVLDGTGIAIDGGPPLTGEAWAVDRPAPPALTRPPITAPLPTGVRAIDTLLTLGRGQRVGLFSAAGVGKSTLLGQIARGAAADVIVLCLVGERGRELAELLGEELAPARGRTVVVCATSDAPALVRLRAIHVATAIAEWFRERRGASVLLLCDSLTRVARAQREVGLSAGEPPARHGYPPSVFALLPRLIERTGATPAGVITALYTVLVAGNDLDEPIADEVRGLVDGHIILDRRLAQRGHFPPIDVVASNSRLMHRVIAPQHADAAARQRARLAIYEEHRDLITLGAYQHGRDAAIDDAIATYPAIERLLRQRRDEAGDWETSLGHLLSLTANR